MNYAISREILLQEFRRRPLSDAVARGERWKWCHQVDSDALPAGVEAVLRYPGYKTDLDENPPQYDYRVDIIREGDRATLSHASILLDIHNKCLRNGDLVDGLRALLLNMYPNNTADPLDGIPAIRDYTGVAPPGGDLLDEVHAAYRALGKSFDDKPNEYDLRIEEFLVMVKWITLQEDFNYPKARHQGRRMPFCRYLEAVHASVSGRSLYEVVQRALAHGRPPALWCELDYGVVLTAPRWPKP